MDFFVDFGFFALLLIATMAFMGIITTKIAERFGGKKGHEAHERSANTKKGWRNVGGKRD